MNEAGKRLWRRWIVAFTAGELIGFGGIPVLFAAAGLWLTQPLEPPARAVVMYLLAVTGGLGEGAVLAWFQLRVLKPHLPALNRARWLRATAIAAAWAWACGMLAPTLADLFGISTAAQIAIWIPAGVAILLSIGAAQAWALQDVVEGHRRWIGANALGWLAGLPWTFVIPALLPEDSPTALWMASLVIAGALMGLTAGAVTGGFLVRLRPL
jgi:hypothetical protein